MFFNGENVAIKFVKDDVSMILEAKRKATKRVRLKIVTPKQMLQRLPTAPAQVKTDNASQNFLSKILHLIYF